MTANNRRKQYNSIRRFVDIYFYNKETNDYTYRPSTDGVDSSFFINGLHYLCKEYTSLREENTLHDKVRIELSYLDNKNEEREGWLFSNHKRNNSYLFTWIDNHIKEVMTDSSDVLDAEILLVQRDKLICSILDNIASIDMITTAIKLLRAERGVISNKDLKEVELQINGVRFILTTSTDRMPISLEIDRGFLRLIADYNVSFTKEIPCVN